METIKHSTTQMTKMSLESSLRLSSRHRKPTSYFSPVPVPTKEIQDAAQVNVTCNRPGKRSTTSNFTAPSCTKFDKLVEKSIKSLKLNLNNDSIVVYYCIQDRSNFNIEWKQIKNLENFDYATTYKLRVYKKPAPKKEVKIQDPPPVKAVVEETSKNQPTNKVLVNCNPQMMQYGFYCYWYYMMLMRGYEFGGYNPYNQYQ